MQALREATLDGACVVCQVGGRPSVALVSLRGPPRSLCLACLRAVARRKADATQERSQVALASYADEFDLDVLTAGAVAYAVPSLL
ncbi:MAG: hypothetical protein ACYDBQ_02815 [Thermoplasmatota archaeon]